MRRSTLAALHRLRGETLERAQRELARTLAVEADRLRDAAAADQRIADEAQAATDLAADDGAVEAYSRWLPGAREQARRLHRAAEAASTDLGVARAAVSLARAAVASAERALEAHDRAVRAEQAAREQRELDEIAGRSGRERG